MAKRGRAEDDDKLTHSRVMMLLESLEKQIRIIAEGQVQTNEKLKLLDKLNRDMEIVKAELVVIKTSLKNKASIIEVKALEERLAVVEAQMH